jgi:hypothetical protein
MCILTNNTDNDDRGRDVILIPLCLVLGMITDTKYICILSDRKEDLRYTLSTYLLGNTGVWYIQPRFICIAHRSCSFLSLVKDESSYVPIIYVLN